MRITAATLSIIFLICNVVSATQTPSHLNSAAIYVPLEDSHLIVRGQIVNVTVERKTLGEWGAVEQDDRAALWPIDIASITVLVRETLKGTWKFDEITFHTRGKGDLFTEGREMIICARKRMHNGSEIWTAGEHLGLYSRSKGNRWTLVTTDAALRASETLSYEALVGRIRHVDLPNVVAASDIVAKGVIASVEEASYSSSDGRAGKLTRYTLRVEELLKGSSTSGLIEFVVPHIDASYVPSWTRLVPVGISKGQEWYVFLRMGDLGAYAFAGPNSLLLLDGNRLVFDMTVDYPLPPKEAKRIIISEVSREN